MHNNNDNNDTSKKKSKIKFCPNCGYVKKKSNSTKNQKIKLNSHNSDTRDTLCASVFSQNDASLVAAEDIESLNVQRRIV